jgi:hypothetical protein
VPTPTDRINRIIDDAIRHVPDEATRQRLRKEASKQIDEQLRPLFREWAESLKQSQDWTEHYSARATLYETRGIEFASSALRTLTYLNGGGLIAIPAAVALFQTDVTRVKVQMLTAAILFVAGLLLVLAAQVGAFLALTQRAGGEYLAQQKRETLVEFAFESSKSVIEFFTSADKLKAGEEANVTWEAAWLLLAGFLFCASFVCFVVGCSFGARALLME